MKKATYKIKPHYTFMRELFRWGLKLYYRRLQIVGYENLQKEVPTFFAVNHQNAFMDALVVGGNTKGRQHPNYITRSDVFNEKTLKFLELWKMLPIYRQRDGSDYIQKNEVMFQRFIDILKSGDTLLIFPEGNHGRVRKLRVLRKGIGRIAFQAMDQMEEADKDIQIVPVGLNYSDHLKLRADMLLVFGKPLHLKDYYELYQENDRKALINLRNDLATSMQDLMIHIKPQEYYESIEGLRTLASDYLLENHPGTTKDQFHRLKAEKEMIAKVEEGLKSGDIDGEALNEEVGAYFKGLGEMKIRDHVVKNQPYGMGGLLLKGLGLLLGLPAFIWGYLNHALVYHFSINMTRKMFKDDHFHSSVMFLMAFFLFPIAYLVQAGIVWAVADWKWALGYLLTLPFFGNFALVYSRWFKKWRGRWNFQTLFNRGDQKAKELVAQRESIFGKLKGWLKKDEKVTLNQ